MNGISNSYGTGSTADRGMAIAKLNETTVTKMKDGSKKVKKVVRNTNGETLATFSYTIAAPKNYAKLKKLQYNFKQISAMLMSTKTSNAASQVVSKARRKVVTLQRQKSSGQYDDEALDNAIMHAKRIERVAKKRMRHLRQEEAAANNGTVCVSELDEALKSENSDENLEPVFEEAGSEEEMLENSEEELKQLMRELAEAMKEAEEEMPDEFSLNDLLEIPDPNMSPEDLERLKKKHRSEEMRDIMEADMKYLRAMFEKLAREQQANAAMSISSGDNSSAGSSLAISPGTGNAQPAASSSAGASLEIAGVDMTAPSADMPIVTVEGGSIDVIL